MPLRFRAWTTGLGIAAILPLLILLFVAAPDGQQRMELAQFLGRFHPLAVHLPIALLLLVPVLEAVGFFRKKTELRQSADFVLGLAAVAAIASAWLGWLLAWSGGYEGALVTRHMWGGLSLAAAILLCWSLREWKPREYSAVLLATICLMSWAADQGGKLTHGETFLTEYMPEPIHSWFGEQRKSAIDPSSFYATRIQPIFDEKCTLCHNAAKFKGKLRLDSYENAMHGGKDGLVVRAGETGKSELVRRITLSPENKDFMPADAKPTLTTAEIKIIELWIAAGATPNIAETALQGLPASPEKSVIPLPVTADYRPLLKTIAALESSLGVRLVPRSQIPTDGLILRTMSAPGRCNDTTLQQLAPIADLIVDAELARTRVTDKGMAALSSFSNLQFLDLSNTAVTADGAKELMKLGKMESLNLTATKVKRTGVVELQSKPGMKRIYLFETH